MTIPTIGVSRRLICLALVNVVLASSLVACSGGETGTQPPPAAKPVATVALAPDSASIMEGQSASYTATTRDADGSVLAGRAVSWTVSDNAVATLTTTGATATVLGARPGVVTITATSEGRSATARVVVRPVPVAAVTLSAASIQLIATRTRQVDATTKDSTGKALTGRTVTWSSAAPSIATVSASGLVTAMAPGTATITASAEGKSATATVTVTAAAPSGSWGMATVPLGMYHQTGLDMSFIPFGTQGDFNADGRPDFVVAGWTLYADNSRWSSQTLNPAAPLRIFLQRADGTFENATARLVGSELMVYGQEPLVGDVNKDGVDDIILPGFTDLPPLPAPGVALISGGGAFTRKTLAPDMWVHGASLADVDADGCIDIVGPEYRASILRGDCSGNFTRKGINGIAMGMHTCSADLNGDGDLELVVPDGFRGDNFPSVLQDNFIFDVDWKAAQWTAVSHALPAPVWDRGRTGIQSQQASHDQRCSIGDLDADGRPDIVVSATRWAADGVSWDQSSKIQVYLNKGSLQFEDVSDRAFPGRSDLTQSTFTPKLTDLNGDGRLDLLYPADGYGRYANQAWLGNGDGSFRPAPGMDWPALHTAAKASVAARGLTTDDTNWAVIPIRRADGRYDFVVPVTAFDNVAQRRHIWLEYSPAGWVF